MPNSPVLPEKSTKLATQQSVDSAIWAICDVVRRGNLSSGLLAPLAVAGFGVWRLSDNGVAEARKIADHNRRRR